MQSVPDEESVFTFRLLRRAPDCAEWLPASRLLVHVADSGTGVPARLSWATEDGRRWEVGFAPDMGSCYGHCLTRDGELTEMRGELDDRRPYAETAGGAHEFDTEVEDAGTLGPAGRLRLWIDDGGGTPLSSVAWADRSGNAVSVVLRSASPSGKADAGDLVRAVTASAEHPHAGEVAGNLVDASTRKWFAPRNRASVDFRLTRPVAVERYVLTSADDAPDRDPATWTLYGSADGQAWRLLDDRSGESFTERHQSRTFTISEPAAYDRYRLDLSSNGSPHLQLEAVRFLADGGTRFTGHRRRADHAPAAYRGTRVARTPSGVPSRPLPEDAPAAEARPAVQAPGDTSSSRAGDRPAGAEGGQPGGWWLPLGGRLSRTSLTSPSGRFTALHSVYDPTWAVRDNATGERVWISDAPSSNQICLGPDGNLVARDHHGNQVWSTGTGWRGVRRLEMRDSGDLALTAADGAVVWSSGVRQVPARAGGEGRTVARGSTVRRGESLRGQSLTSGDGSTLLVQDGRAVLIDAPGWNTHWSRSYDQEVVLRLDEDGFLRARALDGGVLEQIAGPGAELVVVRDRAELRDDEGAVVWTSTAPATWQAPAREPAMPHNDALASWFRSLTGEGRGYSVAVVKGSTPGEVLPRTGLAPDSVVTGTWRELQRLRDAAEAGEGHVVAAVAVGQDVLVVSDDPGLPVAALAPTTSVAALHKAVGAADIGGTFSLHQEGGLVSELRDEPRRRKGTGAAEVAAALEEIAHPYYRHELLFRVCGVVPGAAALGGPLLGGVLAPAPPSPVRPEGLPGEPPLTLEGYDEESLDPLVIRTDFTDEGAWDRVVTDLRKPWGEDRPEPCVISDRRFAGVPAGQVLQDLLAAAPSLRGLGVFFIADGTTMQDVDHPLLAVSTEWDGEPFQEDEEEFVTLFRLRPDAAVEISVNLGLGNMDFEDFAGDGVHERMV